jgi:hypothetical protein
MTEEDPKSDEPRVWQPRFGLATLLMVMLICCIVAAAAYYLIRAFQGGTRLRTMSLTIAMAAPALLVVLFSLVKAFIDWTRRSRRR